MRKVVLNMEGNKKYIVIKKLVETNGNKKRAAIHLNCTKRHINRMIVGYKEHGKCFFVHGNRGKKPTHTLSDKTRQDIVDLYRTKYYDANFTHYTELLEKRENIVVSANCVRNILMEELILSPKARRITKKKVKAHLRELQKAAKTPKESVKILDAIVAVEDAHPRRPRCAYTGEMLQMDASMHTWFGNTQTHLHIALDDATGAIMGAYFDTQETLHGYYNVLNQVLTNYGIPYMLFTDKRTVFEYKRKNTSSAEEDTYTQFSYACNQLGVELQTSSIPQSKGRVERVFQTLQSRIPVEMRLNGIATLEQANESLNSHIKEFNAQFALPLNSTKSVFELQPDKEKINLVLAVLTGRKVDSGHCIKFNNTYYKLMDSNGYPVYYRRGTSGMVVKAFNGDMFFSIENKVYALEAIPVHEHRSRNFDLCPKQEKPKKRYIPPMSHPWKQASFEKYLKKQAHRQDIA